jgi:CPA2 family monovalent cation:H+ antiporter-2
MDEAHTHLPYLRETLIFLALAGLLIPVLQRYRVNQILGFLAVGALLGPYGLLQFAGQLPWLANITFLSVEGIRALGELGVLFLMFSIGLELSAERLWALRRWVFGAGTAQVLLSALLIGAIAFAFGNTPEASIVLGLVLALSSTAVVMQLMTEQDLFARPLGQANFSVLMLQDLAVVPILLLIGVLTAGASSGLPALVGGVLLKSIGAILLIYLLGRRVIRPLFRSLARQRQPAAFLALTLLSTLGIASLTEAAGLSMALGALLAGLLLAETEYRHEVEVVIDPFKSLLLGLFFLSVGMQIDLRAILATPLMIPLSVIGLFLLKGGVLALVLRAGGHGWGRAIEGGLLMGQGGEFAFIVTGYAMAGGLFDRDLSQFILLVVSLSMFATPMMARAGRAIGDALSRRAPAMPLEDAEPEGLSGHVIIVGFGRIGQLLAGVLNAEGVRYVAIDIDMRRSTRRHALGEPVYYGDVRRPELLHRVHADKAAAIVLTMNHPESALLAAEAIRREFGAVPLLARAHDEAHARQLRQAGASMVMPEALEAALQLSSFVLQAIGVDSERAARAVGNERRSRLSATHAADGG